ncbi:MAG: PqqD family protein [Lentisphaeria bacterium]|nr:PqqD family protein [Lentisphaeria bacterium]
MTDMSLNDVCRKSDDIVAREIEGEMIIIPMTAGIGDMEDEIYALDEISLDIWNRIDGIKSAGQIAQELDAAYDASLETIQADVLGLLGELVKRGIILT